MSSTPILDCEKLHSDAIIPTRAHPTDAGLDLYTYQDFIVPSKTVGIKIPTGIALKLLPNTCGVVAGKSGLALKGIDILGGIADENYRGNYMVIIYNHSEIDYHFKQGDKIAQLLIVKIEYPVINIVDKLNSTDRGDKGFGSTGMNVSDINEIKEN